MARSSSEIIEALAAEIGEQVYMDIAKWHLYLSNAHLHTVLAERFYPLMTQRSLTEAAVLKILEELSVKLGGGRREVPLIDLLPMPCQLALLDLLERFQQDL
ncbi:hypothetical protein DO97_05265 [Neosynechococcus sphagnicola sy1]|uniref:Thylakoid-associated protein n=1 Tax=Neosynechococcus sphagnicola sy1 TaxID=1497020 RepID=A0A098TPJ0_9CYAN|nr:DUF3181 family protein [Neosynechococcus sphagnicola]KGF72748.1 hypothetical protein DO97_05265 [Neosynechococcus sphagnicola sy1]